MLFDIYRVWVVYVPSQIVLSANDSLTIDNEEVQINCLQNAI